jgi:type II secretory pathway pseudopilin PulG
MITRAARGRSGITLTEILISILIMGIGLISLATLFPIGLVRLRDAARQSRSALLFESAAAEIGSKNLLDKSTFSETYYGSVDPFLMDLDPATGTQLNAFLSSPPALVRPISGPGLPVCYDPLWRVATATPPPFYNTAFRQLYGLAANTLEYRFGAGVVGGNTLLRRDPDGGLPSAWGLQRISNFAPFTTNSNAVYPTGTTQWPFTFGNGIRDLAADTFVSPDDLVMQNDGKNQQILTVTGNGTTGDTSGVVPMFFPTGAVVNGVSINQTQNDWKFSWFFTGRQVDMSNGTMFEGDIVVTENRQFGIDTANWNGTTVPVASGETVIEAVFGPGRRSGQAIPYFASGASQTVLLRWPSNVPDPEIKVGSWIADVTYDRNPSTAWTRFDDQNFTLSGTNYPMQRCFWYQVAKRTEPNDEYDTAAPPAQSGYRRMTIYTTTPLRAQTLLDKGGSPVHVNAALVMPSVVNVFSKTFYVR